MFRSRCHRCGGFFDNASIDRVLCYVCAPLIGIVYTNTAAPAAPAITPERFVLEVLHGHDAHMLLRIAHRLKRELGGEVLAIGEMVERAVHTYQQNGIIMLPDKGDTP